MDIRSFFGSASSSKSTDVSSSSEDEIDSNQSDTECLEPSPAKKRLTVHEKRRRKLQAVENTTRNGKRALVG